jgi:uncharacterized protein YuzE
MALNMNWSESGFALDFQAGCKSYFVDGVIDHEGDGTLIGIEILGLLAECEGLQEPDAKALQDAGLVSVSIDHDADAIYIRARSGRATHQLVRHAVVIVDDERRLCRVHVSSQGPNPAR